MSLGMKSKRHHWLSDFLPPVQQPCSLHTPACPSSCPICLPLGWLWGQPLKTLLQSIRLQPSLWFPHPPILLSLPSPHRLLPHKQCRHFWVLFICLLSVFPCQTRNSLECCLPCLPECPSGEFCTPCSHSVNIEMETQPLTPTFHQQIPTEPTQSQGGFPGTSKQ